MDPTQKIWQQIQEDFLLFSNQKTNFWQNVTIPNQA